MKAKCEAAEISEKWVTVGGFTTRYLEAGSDKSDPVLLLHDGAWGGSSSGSWSRILPLVAQNHHVLAPDLLGFGGSDKVVFLDRAQYEPRIVQVKNFLDAVGVSSPVHVVGNSFGGSLALRLLAQDRGERLRSVVSICGTGGPWRSALSISELGHWNGTELDLRRIVDLLIDSPAEAEGHLNERMRWASEPGHYRAVMAATTPLPAPLSVPRAVDTWPTELDGVLVPTLFVAGQRDELLERDWTARLTGVLPHALVQELDFKHSINIDHPAQTFELLSAFWEGLPPVRALGE